MARHFDHLRKPAEVYRRRPTAAQLEIGHLPRPTRCPACGCEQRDAEARDCFACGYPGES